MCWDLIGELAAAYSKGSVGSKPRDTAMQQIADWLEKLGMSEYAQRFAENRIDFSVLRDLTDQDLKDLGIVLGDRRKMLRAIVQTSAERASLGGSRCFTGSTFAACCTSTASTIAPLLLSDQEIVGERRHVTVMSL